MALAMFFNFLYAGATAIYLSFCRKKNLSVVYILITDGLIELEFET